MIKLRLLRAATSVTQQDLFFDATTVADERRHAPAIFFFVDFDFRVYVFLLWYMMKTKASSESGYVYPRFRFLA